MQIVAKITKKKQQQHSIYEYKNQYLRVYFICFFASEYHLW